MAEDEIENRKLYAVGGSAGSLGVILQIIEAIPYGFKGSFVIVVHRRNEQEPLLADLLRNRTHLNVKEAEDKEPIENGSIYIAPANYHLLAESQSVLSLDSSERIHFSRPSIDVSFESLAAVFGERLTGILLSGANADGAKGLLSIKQQGGQTLVQDPSTAHVRYMPDKAILMGGAIQVLSPAGIISAILHDK